MVKDPSYIWIAGQFLALNDEEAGVGVEVREREGDIALPESDAAREALRRITEGFASGSISWSPVEAEPSRDDGAWRATMTSPAAVIEWVVVARGEQMAFLSISGIPDAERDFIIGSFAFREPPGDPLSPPPPRPTPTPSSS